MANKPGLGSDNMSEADKQKIHRMGGEASGGSASKASSSSASSRASGAAGKTEAAKRGGMNSHRGADS